MLIEVEKCHINVAISILAEEINPKEQNGDLQLIVARRGEMIELLQNELSVEHQNVLQLKIIISILF